MTALGGFMIDLKHYYSTHRHEILVGLVFIAAILIRIPFLNRPPLDAHPMRQNDTACVINFFTQHKTSFFKPKTCLIRPSTNSEGYFFLELPIYAGLASIAQQLTGGFNWWSIRMVNLTLFTLAFRSLYLFVKQFWSQKTAFWSVLLLSFTPSSIFFFGQAIHPDVLMIAALTASLLFFGKYLAKPNSKHLLLLIICLNITLATRPFAALSLVPISILLLRKKRYKQTALIFISSFTLYGGWWLWQKRFPEANHDWQNWVLSGREQLLQLPTLKYLIWKNVMGEVIGKVISLLAGLGFLFLLFKQHKQKLFVLSWLAMIPVYWLLVPSGNISHQYYAHVILLPIILTAAIFVTQLLNKIKHRVINIFVSLLIITLVVFNGFKTSRYFYIERVSAEEQAIAKWIEASSNDTDKIIYLGNSSLPLSIAKRQGWTTEQPPADLQDNAKSVLKVLPQADYVVHPSFDDSFPAGERSKLEPSLELATSGELGAIFKVQP